MLQFEEHCHPHGTACVHQNVYTERKPKVGARHRRAWPAASAQHEEPGHSDARVQDGPGGCEQPIGRTEGGQIEMLEPRYDVGMNHQYTQNQFEANRQHYEHEGPQHQK